MKFSAEERQNGKSCAKPRYRYLWGGVGYAEDATMCHLDPDLAQTSTNFGTVCYWQVHLRRGNSL